jgi:hypothetical protein
LRHAAAEARRLLVQQAAKRLDVAESELTVAAGAVSGKGKSI